MVDYTMTRNVQTLALPSSGTTVSNSNQNLNGLLYQVNTIVPTLGGGTAQITIVDSDGMTVFTGTATNSASKHADTPTAPIALSGLYTVTVNYSQSQSSGVTTTATLILKGR